MAIGMNLGLYAKLVAKGFPPEFATNMCAMMYPHLARITEADRNMIESYIPLIAGIVEEAWLGHVEIFTGTQPSDPTLKPQVAANREP